jgi:hypothetical protein
VGATLTTVTVLTTPGTVTGARVVGCDAVTAAAIRALVSRAAPSSATQRGHSRPGGATRISGYGGGVSGPHLTLTANSNRRQRPGRWRW